MVVSTEVAKSSSLACSNVMGSGPIDVGIVKRNKSSSLAMSDKYLSLIPESVASRKDGQTTDSCPARIKGRTLSQPFCDY